MGAGFFERLFQLLQHKQLWMPLAVVLSTAATTALSIGFWFGRYFPKSNGPQPTDSVVGALNAQIQICMAHASELQEKLDEALAREAKNDKLHEAILDDESELWRLHEPKPPAGYSIPINVSRPKIIVIANNKGGVGKTTLTSGLAAYFEKKKNKRVLLIDLDYQGSLTNWMIKSADIFIPPNQAYRLSLANKLIDGTAQNQWQAEVLRNGQNGHGLVEAQLITSDYTLTEVEAKLMLRWIQNGDELDVRYNVAKILLGPHVQDETYGFDIVMIDAPPRLTTGTIGALVASTHLVVPTILDPLSAETVGSFLRQAWALRVRLNPGLELAGVVGTMTPARPLGKDLGSPEEAARGIVSRGIREWQASTHVFVSDIQDVAAIKNCAGRENPYFSSPKAREMFDAFGDELCGRISV
jgi:cellulose biosynthesis protein BcsQ